MIISLKCEVLQEAALTEKRKIDTIQVFHTEPRFLQIKETRHEKLVIIFKFSLVVLILKFIPSPLYYKEQILWCVSAGIMTCSPPCLLMSMLNEKIIEKNSELPLWLSKFMIQGLEFLLSSLFFIYTIAKMIILVLAFMQLRALPPSAYETKIDPSRLISVKIFSDVLAVEIWTLIVCTSLA